jgi:hypothetical protein
MYTYISIYIYVYIYVCIRTCMYVCTYISIYLQRISQGLQRAGEIIAVVGPSPIKSLRSALVAGDEEKALSIYITEKGGKTLEEDLHPSMPFPTKKYQVDTPLHLAAEAALGKLVKIFLTHGGNPNSANGKGETCLHSICRRPDNSSLRLVIMNTLLDWKGIEDLDGRVENVSINHVDTDGNAAVHYASMNGLLGAYSHEENHLLFLCPFSHAYSKAESICFTFMHIERRFDNAPRKNLF